VGVRVLYLFDGFHVHGVQMLENVQTSSGRQSSKHNETVFQANGDIGCPMSCCILSLLEVQQLQNDG
jgi:hypothetical protein